MHFIFMDILLSLIPLMERVYFKKIRVTKSLNVDYVLSLFLTNIAFSLLTYF